VYFVTLKVDPQINVIAMRNLSALGNNGLLLLLACILCVFSVSGCGSGDTPRLPEETFEQIYGDILFLGELHREDTLAMRKAVDSLLEAHNTDSTTLLATARELADDSGALNEIYRNLILRFESLTVPDSGKEVPEWDRPN
jgi:hypothetical protein